MDRIEQIRAKEQAATPGQYDYCKHCSNSDKREFYVHPCPSCIHGNKDWFSLAEGHELPSDEISTLKAENERMWTELEAAKSDIAAFLRDCVCEHRHEYCKGSDLEECSGDFPGDCSGAEWRGIGGKP